tara:strand:+ start:233 stop:694 length:462 start_codon:yes stop_codon:yes gene_type:complete
MKKLLTVFIALTFSLGSYAQDEAKFKEVFSKYASRDDAFSLTLNKKMLDAIDMDFDFEDQIKHVSGDIHQIRFIVFGEEEEGASLIRSFSKEVYALGFKRIPFEFEDSDLQVFKMYGNKEGGYFTNIHLFVLDENFRAYFISIKGKLKIKNQA